MLFKSVGRLVTLLHLMIVWPETFGTSLVMVIAVFSVKIAPTSQFDSIKIYIRIHFYLILNRIPAKKRANIVENITTLKLV